MPGGLSRPAQVECGDGRRLRARGSGFAVRRQQLGHVVGRRLSDRQRHAGHDLSLLFLRARSGHKRRVAGGVGGQPANGHERRHRPQRRCGVERRRRHLERGRFAPRHVAAVQRRGHGHGQPDHRLHRRRLGHDRRQPVPPVPRYVVRRGATGGPDDAAPGHHPAPTDRRRADRSGRGHRGRDHGGDDRARCVAHACRQLDYLRQRLSGCQRQRPARRRRRVRGRGDADRGPGGDDCRAGRLDGQ